ncbi:hypothetical protein Q7P37_006772 [Cladosporium fusiforme]
MGKGGRIACIFTPMALTIASLIAIACLEVSGWSVDSSLNTNYLMSVDFSNFSAADAGNVANRTELTAALTLAHDAGALKETYQVYLWNYCTANKTAGDIDWCSDRESNFIFDPVEEFALNSTTAEAPTGTSDSDNAIASKVNELKGNAKEFEDKVLGDSASAAMKTYRKVAKWNFIAYQVSFWTTLITIVVGLLAICSRWGSLCTWIMAIISTLFTFLAALTTTILFSTLSGALHTLLDPYNIKVRVGTRALAIAWIATALSIVATLFWLFSICCCSGRSNPHHKSNKGGLWQAEPKGGNTAGRRSIMSLGKTGTAYERVESPYVGGDRVPLRDYPQQPTQYEPPQPYGGAYGQQPQNAYEPYRQQQQARW